MIKVVVLDFDDTLCLTEENLFNLENEVARQMKVTPMTHEAHKKNFGVPLEIAIKERLPGVDFSKFIKIQEKVIEQFIKSEKMDRIPSENLKVLDRLKKKGKKIAILTSRSQMEARHLMHEKHPLSTRVEAFYHRDNSLYLKPDPRVFNKIFLHFKVLPSECVYVGDAPSDGLAAKGANMHFIAVLEAGIRTKNDFANIKVDFFAKRFVDITSYIL